MTAEASSAVRSAQPNESTSIAPSVSASAAISISASATSTSRKVVAIVNGSRIAASTGGTIAFSTAITAIDEQRAPEARRPSTCGTIVRGEDQRDRAQHPRDEQPQRVERGPSRHRRGGAVAADMAGVSQFSARGRDAARAFTRVNAGGPGARVAARIV